MALKTLYRVCTVTRSEAGLESVSFQNHSSCQEALSVAITALGRCDGAIVESLVVDMESGIRVGGPTRVTEFGLVSTRQAEREGAASETRSDESKLSTIDLIDSAHNAFG